MRKHRGSTFWNAKTAGKLSEDAAPSCLRLVVFGIVCQSVSLSKNVDAAKMIPLTLATCHYPQVFEEFEKQIHSPFQGFTIIIFRYLS